MDGSFDGRAFSRGDGGYERTRRAAVWNARAPERFPDLIVVAASTDDVVRAVRHAAAEGMKIGVRSGGHSRAGNHVRDGGMLIDVSALRETTLDAESGTATAQPRPVPPLLLSNA